MMRKGQLNQVFIMIFAIIIIGTVALLGVRSVGGLLDDKCTVDMVTFKDKITGSIANRNDFGAVNEERFSSPCGFANLCLVDWRVINYYDNNPGVSAGTAPTEFPDYTHPSSEEYNYIIDDSVRDAVRNNIFLVNEEYTVAVGYAEELQVDDTKGIVCMPARAGTFSIKMSGLGRFTAVSESITDTP